MMFESSIDRVKVYRHGATVTRSVTVQAVEGALPTSIELPELPIGLMDVSVRLQARDVPQGADVALHDARVGLHAKPREEAIQEPDEIELERVEREILTLQKRSELLQSERQQLMLIELPNRPEGLQGRPPPASPIAARAAIEAFTDEAIDARLSEQRDIRDALLALRDQAQELRDRRARASTAKRARADEVTKTVLATLRHTGDALDAVTIELSYFVPGARWAPQYQCYLSRDGTGAVLQHRAVVIQSSGEDWKRVSLELSTASPLQWTELPKLSSIRIGKAQPPTPASAGFRPAPRGAGALFSNYDQARKRAGALVPAAPRFSAPALSVSDLPTPTQASVATASAVQTYQQDRSREVQEFEEPDEMMEELDDSSAYEYERMEAPAKLAAPMQSFGAAAAPPPARAGVTPSVSGQTLGARRRAADPQRALDGRLSRRP